MTTETQNSAAVAFDFSYADPTDKVMELEIPWLVGKPVLLLKPATEANVEYREALLKTSGARTRDLTNRLITKASGGKTAITAQDVIQDREDDRVLFPKYVVTDWRNVFSNGKPIEFSVEAALAFFAALPQWIMDRIRVFALRNENFITRGLEPDPDVNELAGN